MSGVSPRHRAAFAFVALAGAALDLWSKHVAFVHMQEREVVVVVERFFEIGKTTNPGIVFGLLPGAKTVFLWVSIIAVPAIIAIFASLKKPHWVMTASLGLILGGTIGNAYDRVAFGEVRDFIKFWVPSFRTWPPTMREWPLFNIADSCICVGVALLSLEMLFFDDRKKKRKESAPAAGVPSGPTEPIPGNIPSGPTEPIPSPDAPGVPSGPTEPVPVVSEPPKSGESNPPKADPPPGATP